MLNALFCVRLVVLGLVAAAAAAACVLFPQALPLRSAITLDAALILAAVISFIHLRHIGLAVLTATAPIPGLLIAHIAGPTDAVTMVLAWLPGFACAAFLADEIAARIATGIERNIAAEDALRGLGLSGVLAIAVSALALGALWFFFPSPLAIAIIATTMGAGLSAILVLPLAATLLSFSEEFVTRANRLREWRERMLDPVTAIAEPRWAMSVTGIAIIFAVLAAFSAHLAYNPQQSIIAAALLLPAFAAAVALTRDWRRAIAVPLVLALVLAMGLWGITQIHAHLSQRTMLLMLQTLGICLVPAFLLAVEAGRYLSEDAASAAILALLRKGIATIFVFLAAALALVAQLRNAEMTAVLLVMLAFGWAGTMFFTSAFAAALESLIPRRATLEARYRVR